MKDTVLNVLIREKHVLSRREKTLSGHLRLVEFLKVLDEFAALLYAQNKQVFSGTLSDFLVQTLKLGAYGCT